jgi:hypothetical protein
MMMGCLVELVGSEVKCEKCYWSVGNDVEDLKMMLDCFD